MREDQEGFSMPLSAPAYCAPPFYAAPGSKLLLVFFQAAKAALKYEVPKPLELSEEAVALAWIGDMSQPTHTVDLYHESLIALKVRYREYLGWYIAYLWTSNDEATLFARELYGWPGQLSENNPLRFNGSQIFGICNRNSEILMRISLHVTSPPPQGRKKPLEDDLSKLIAGDWLQIRKFPSPEKDGKPIKQLLHIPTTDFRVHEIWSGTASLELGSSGYYPNLDKLKPQKILGAFYIKPEWVVPYAKIIWNSTG